MPEILINYTIACKNVNDTPFKITKDMNWRAYFVQIYLAGGVLLAPFAWFYKSFLWWRATRNEAGVFRFSEKNLTKQDGDGLVFCKKASATVAANFFPQPMVGCCRFGPYK